MDRAARLLYTLFGKATNGTVSLGAHALVECPLIGTSTYEKLIVGNKFCWGESKCVGCYVHVTIH